MSALKIIVCMKDLCDYERRGELFSLVPDVKKDAENLFIEAYKMFDQYPEMDPIDIYPDGILLQIVKPTDVSTKEDEHMLASYMDQITSILELLMYGKYDTLFDCLSTIQIVDANNLIVRGCLSVVACDIVAAETPSIPLGSQGVVSAAMENDGRAIVSIPDVKQYGHLISEMTVRYLTKILSTFL